MAHRVAATNTATASTNRIHDDAVARRYGFRGGLVPGVDVYAYLTHAPVEAWGRAWLEGGAMSLVLRSPVYDGEVVTVDAEPDGDGGLELTLGGPDHTVRAVGRATSGEPPAPHGAEPPAAELPDVRPPASSASLRPGTVLGSLREVFDADLSPEYLTAVGEDLPVYASERIAHPGWLLRRANSALSRNVELGPWIHVSSEVALLGTLGHGEVLDVRAAVLDEHERGGHRFVTLDVAMSCAGRPIQRVRHTAIHTPRQRPA